MTTLTIITARQHLPRNYSVAGPALSTSEVISGNWPPNPDVRETEAMWLSNLICPRSQVSEQQDLNIVPLGHTAAVLDVPPSS